MNTNIKQEFIQDFGEAYQRFGLPKLMGRIIALLIYSSGEKSLDEITEELGVSKGPVSQMLSRLRDHNLVQRIWRPGDRKDYYASVDDIFGNAFRNQIAIMQRNLGLARKYRDLLPSPENIDSAHFSRRIQEMEAFYKKMVEAYTEFHRNWVEIRKIL